MEDIKEAMEIINKQIWKCPKCGTYKEFMVLGVRCLVCKCESDKLCKTKYVKYYIKLMEEFVNEM